MAKLEAEPVWTGGVFVGDINVAVVEEPAVPVAFEPEPLCDVASIH
jgi:hypothetical protein